ncbi:hypothetical protein C7212DRAFT_348254 [Tuber magnatum]|uniref:Uncharacterized protein n=1 Tax=Tuber magnatum TaxID=42249 RepID=A0A317SFX6_9PEZI|nr:hypothetical protein C7212DRAFT_348254 [Tuber magnatum]
MKKSKTDLCDELREGYRDWCYNSNYPLEDLVAQLEGIENELDFMARCFNDIKTGECREINAREHISLGIGRLLRDLEDLSTNMKNENHYPLETLCDSLGPVKGISGVVYRARDFCVSTKWGAIEAVKRSRENLHVRYENMTKSQGIKRPSSTKGLIKSRLTFASLSRERERYLKSSRSLPTLGDRRGRGENPRDLHQRANSTMSDLIAGQKIYDRAWEEAGKRIRLALERITNSSEKDSVDKPEETGKGKIVEPR